jgi:hypothetical protein
MESANPKIAGPQIAGLLPPPESERVKGADSLADQRRARLGLLDEPEEESG